MMFNPRFPHTLRVLRVQGTDEEGLPIYERVPLEMVVMRGGVPVMGADGRFETEMVETLPCGYRNQGLSKGTQYQSEVVTSDYTLSTPMFLTQIQPTDIIELTDYDRTFRAEVVKKITTNLGSNIWINEVRG